MTRSRSDLFVLMAFVAGCAFEPGNPPDAAMLDDDACEHLAEGATALEAGVTAEDAVELHDTHVVYELSGEEPLFARFEAAEEGDVSIYFVNDVDAHVLAGDEELEPEASRPSETCPGFARVDTYHLEPGEYVLEIHGSDAEAVLLLPVRGGGHHDEDEGESGHDHEH